MTRHKKAIRAFVFAQSELAPDILENIYENVDPDNQTEFDIAVVPYKTNAVYRILLDTPMFRFYKEAYDKEELFKIAVIGDNEWAVERNKEFEIPFAHLSGRSPKCIKTFRRVFEKKQ